MNYIKIESVGDEIDNEISPGEIVCTVIRGYIQLSGAANVGFKLAISCL